MSRLHPRVSAPTTPLPHPTTLLHRAPAHSFLAPASQYVFETVQAHAKYARCVQRAGRVRGADHVPPNPPPRSRPRPEPGHHDRATQAPATRRARPISTSIRFFGDRFLHTPARNADPRLLYGDSTPIRAILRLRNAFPHCRHSAQAPLFTVLPPRSTATPKGYRAMTVSTANHTTNRARRTRPPCPLSRTTYMSPFRLPCRVLSLLHLGRS
ncbi:hypothetical protein B0H14DRAFT_774963 [Mycena olivaceomarginata]|nr:hypothetical protein B0H14DRAFT_774963 [Mycena olivaceomarginata]